MKLNEIKWKTEEQQQKELSARIANRKEGEGCDGFILIGKEKVTYRWVSYYVMALRYYDHTNQFCVMGSHINRKAGDTHFIVETTKQSQKLREKIRLFIDEYSDFLWHDTLNTWNEQQTLQEQLDWVNEKAREDIDILYGKTIKKEVERKIKSLEGVLKALEELKEEEK